MFHFLQKKPYLKDLIPSGHIDIHSHLLPGIDDGAATVEDTLFLTQALQQLGFEQCITTPHIMSSIWENTPETIQTAFQTAQTALGNSQNILSGYSAEYLIDPAFVKLFQQGQLLTLKDNLVLVEISYLNPPIQLYDILFDLQIAGYQPVLAHPERYPYYHQKFNEYHKLKNAGCLFQLNLLSTVGYYGIEVAEVAETLLEKGWIDFVGSDVHHENHLKAFANRTLFRNTTHLKKAIENNQFFRK
jgi:protein-tyrosine phosphatase